MVDDAWLDALFYMSVIGVYVIIATAITSYGPVEVLLDVFLYDYTIDHLIAGIITSVYLLAGLFAFDIDV